jgi:hypothetical protein
MLEILPAAKKTWRQPKVPIIIKRTLKKVSKFPSALRVIFE